MRKIDDESTPKVQEDSSTIVNTKSPNNKRKRLISNESEKSNNKPRKYSYFPPDYKMVSQLEIRKESSDGHSSTSKKSLSN
jgi:hypothetical protein